MKPKEFIKTHKVAVDYKNRTTIQMLSISNVHKVVALAEYNLAKDLLKLNENERVEYLKRLVYNFENKSTHEQERKNC